MLAVMGCCFVVVVACSGVVGCRLILVGMLGAYLVVRFLPVLVAVALAFVVPVVSVLLWGGGEGGVVG